MTDFQYFAPTTFLAVSLLFIVYFRIFVSQFQCSGCVTREKLEAFIDAGANLEMKIGFDRHSQSLMQIMAGKGNCVSLISLIDQKKPGLIDRHVCSMLDPAVRHGTSDTVKVQYLVTMTPGCIKLRCIYICIGAS